MGRTHRFADVVARRADLLTALHRHAGLDLATARIVELVAEDAAARAMAAAGVEAATPRTLADVVASGPRVAALTCSGSLRRMAPPVVRRVLTDARRLLPEGAALAVRLDFHDHHIERHRLRHRGYLVLLSCAGWDLVDATVDRVPLRTLRRTGFDGAPDDVAVRAATLVLVGRRNRAVHFRSPAVPVRESVLSDVTSSGAAAPVS